MNILSITCPINIILRIKPLRLRRMNVLSITCPINIILRINKQTTCIIDKSESIPLNAEDRTGTPITGKGVSAATIPKGHARANVIPPKKKIR